jgi:hypothetical protein
MKINLGCGSNKEDGYINIDRHEMFTPDIIHDLEVIPYPFENNSIEEIRAFNIIEHLGQTVDAYLNIWKEFYRICQNNAIIKIIAPHPRHDNFINDPTHIRPITPQSLNLFSKESNITTPGASSKLGLILNINFKILKIVMKPEDTLLKNFLNSLQGEFPMVDNGKTISRQLTESEKMAKTKDFENEIGKRSLHENNLVSDYYIEMQCIKE